MNALYVVFIKIVVAVLLGFILRKCKVINEEMQKGLSDMLVKAFLPFSILASANYEKSPDLGRAMLAVLVGGLIFYAAALISMRLLSKKLSISDKEKRIFVTMTTFANTGFVGFPIMTALYGSEGLLLAVVYNMVYNLYMYTYGLHLISGKKGDLRGLLFQPVNIASLLAIVFFISPITFPNYVTESVDLIAAVTVPLSMIIIGSNLAAMPFVTVLSDVKSYLVSLMRLLVLPGVCLGVVYVLYRTFSMTLTTASVIVLMGALPCGSLNVIFSEKYDCAPEYAARATVQSMMLCAVTIPLMVFLCSKLFV